MFTRAFWRDTAERSVATAAQSAIAVVGVGALPFNLLQVDILGVLGVAAGGAALSVLKALAASKLNDPQSASLVDLPGRHASDR